MNHTDTRFRRLFGRFLAPYLFFILIPVIVLLIVSNHAMNLAHTNAIVNSRRDLEQGKRSFDSYVASADDFSTRMQLNASLTSIQSLSEQRVLHDYYYVFLGAQSLKELFQTVNEVDCIVYYHESGIVLGPSYSCTDFSSEYGRLYRFGDCETYEEFKATYPLKKYGHLFYPQTSYILNDKTYSGIIYARTMSVSADATIFFTLPNKEIEDFFADILDVGSLYVLDAKNQLIAHYGTLEENYNLPDFSLIKDTEELPEEFFGKHNVATFVSSNTGLRFVSVVPDSVVYKDVIYLRYLSLLMLAAAILIALGYAILLAYRSSSRFSAIVNRSGDSLPQYTGGNIYDYLNNSMLSLVSNNQMLQARSEEQHALLRASYLDKLMNSSFQNDAERFKLEKMLRLTLPGNLFSVLVCTLEDLSEESDTSSGEIYSLNRLEALAQAKQKLLDALTPIFHERGYVYSRSMNQVYVFAAFSLQEKAQYQTLCENWMQKTVSAANVPSDFLLKTVGSPLFSDQLRVSEHIEACQETLRFIPLRQWGDQQILWSHPEKTEMSEGTPFFYSEKLESRLSHLIQSGSKEALDTADQLLSENLPPKRQLSAEARLLLLSQIKITLLSVLKTPEMTQRFQQSIYALQWNHSYERFHDHLSNLIVEIVDAFNEQNQASDNSIKEEMLTFVEENFTNPDLSLKYASSEFHLSEAYFSLLFKDLVGVNFSDYLDKLRMMHAQELLKTDMKIDDIAINCGYTLTSTFRRAYKRYYGVSPSQGRKV